MGFDNEDAVWKNIKDIATGNNEKNDEEGTLGKNLLSRLDNGESFILTIAAKKTAASDADVFSTLRWKEIR